MRDRFLLGMWAAYEGLIYPQYDSEVHEVPRIVMKDYYEELIRRGFSCPLLEGYDHGMIAQSCYLFSFVDPLGNVHILDGFYQSEQSIEQSTKIIKDTREYWLAIQRLNRIDHLNMPILADPAVFRRGGTGDKSVVGKTVSDIYYDEGEGLSMERANNEIINGIVKVQSYLAFSDGHYNPYTGEMHQFVTPTGKEGLGAPHLYIAKELSWWHDEIGEYYWGKDTDGNHIDKPKDGNDHAMDTTKYLFTRQPTVAEIIPQLLPQIPGYMKWGESEMENNTRSHRHA